MSVATIPESAVAAKLASVLGAPWVVGTNIFTGSMQPPGGGVPHAAIFVVPYGPESLQPYLGVSKDLRTKFVQVTIRSDVGDEAAGLVVARNVQAALHRADLSAAGYILCLVSSGPLRLGRDEIDHYLWTVNVRMQSVETLS